MEDKKPLAGWIGLLVAGIADLVYGVIYLVWSVVSLVVGGIAGILVAVSAFSRGNYEDRFDAITVVVGAFMPLISAVAFLVVVILAIVAILAAFRYKNHRSKGLVWLGIVGAVLAPALGLISSVTTLCNVGLGCGRCFGFVGGNIGTIIAGVIVIASSGFAVFAMMQPETQEAFDANADDGLEAAL